MRGSSGFRRFARELFSTVTLIALLLFLLFILKVAAVNPGLALALLVALVAYAVLMILGAVFKRLRARRGLVSRQL